MQTHIAAQKVLEDDERILVLPSGGRVNAEYLEEIVMGMVPCVRHAMIVGSHHKFLVCLLSLKLNPDMGGLLLGEEALKLAQMCGSKATTVVTARPCKQFRKGLQHAMAKVNSVMEKEELRISRFTILLHDFSHESGLLRREDGGLNRLMIKKRHQHHIDSMLYDDIAEGGWTIEVPQFSRVSSKKGHIMSEAAWLEAKSKNVAVCVVPGAPKRFWGRGKMDAENDPEPKEDSIEDKIRKARAVQKDSRRSSMDSISSSVYTDTSDDEEIDFSNLRSKLRHRKTPHKLKSAGSASECDDSDNEGDTHKITTMIQLRSTPRIPSEKYDSKSSQTAENEEPKMLFAQLRPTPTPTPRGLYKSNDAMPSSALLLGPATNAASEQRVHRPPPLASLRQAESHDLNAEQGASASVQRAASEGQRPAPESPPRKSRPSNNSIIIKNNLNSRPQSEVEAEHKKDDEPQPVPNGRVQVSAQVKLSVPPACSSSFTQVRATTHDVLTDLSSLSNSWATDPDTSKEHDLIHKEHNVVGRPGCTPKHLTPSHTPRKLSDHDSEELINTSKMSVQHSAKKSNKTLSRRISNAHSIENKLLAGPFDNNSFKNALASATASQAQSLYSSISSREKRPRTDENDDSHTVGSMMRMAPITQMDTSSGSVESDLYKRPTAAHDREKRMRINAGAPPTMRAPTMHLPMNQAENHDTSSGSIDSNVYSQLRPTAAINRNKANASISRNVRPKEDHHSVSSHDTRDVTLTSVSANISHCDNVSHTNSSSGSLFKDSRNSPPATKRPRTPERNMERRSCVFENAPAADGEYSSDAALRILAFQPSQFSQCKHQAGSQGQAVTKTLLPPPPASSGKSTPILSPTTAAFCSHMRDDQGQLAPKQIFNNMGSDASKPPAFISQVPACNALSDPSPRVLQTRPINAGTSQHPPAPPPRSAKKPRSHHKSPSPGRHTDGGHRTTPRGGTPRRVKPSNSGSAKPEDSFPMEFPVSSLPAGYRDVTSEAFTPVTHIPALATTTYHIPKLAFKTSKPLIIEGLQESSPCGASVPTPPARRSAHTPSASERGHGLLRSSSAPELEAKLTFGLAEPGSARNVTSTSVQHVITTPDKLSKNNYASGNKYGSLLGCGLGPGISSLLSPSRQQAPLSPQASESYYSPQPSFAALLGLQESQRQAPPVNDAKQALVFDEGRSNNLQSEAHLKAQTAQSCVGSTVSEMTSHVPSSVPVCTTSSASSSSGGSSSRTLEQNFQFQGTYSEQYQGEHHSSQKKKSRWSFGGFASKSKKATEPKAKTPSKPYTAQTPRHHAAPPKEHMSAWERLMDVDAASETSQGVPPPPVPPRTPRTHSVEGWTANTEISTPKSGIKRTLSSTISSARKSITGMLSGKKRDTPTPSKHTGTPGPIVSSAAMSWTGPLPNTENGPWHHTAQSGVSTPKAGSNNKLACLFAPIGARTEEDSTEEEFDAYKRKFMGLPGLPPQQRRQSLSNVTAAYSNNNNVSVSSHNSGHSRKRSSPESVEHYMQRGPVLNDVQVSVKRKL